MILSSEQRSHDHMIWVFWLCRILRNAERPGLESALMTGQNRHADAVLRHEMGGVNIGVAQELLLDGIEYLMMEAVELSESQRLLAALHRRAVSQETRDPMLVHLVHASLEMLAQGMPWAFLDTARMLTDLPEDLTNEPKWFGDDERLSPERGLDPLFSERVDAFVRTLAAWKERYEHV